MFTRDDTTINDLCKCLSTEFLLQDDEGDIAGYLGIQITHRILCMLQLNLLLALNELVMLILLLAGVLTITLYFPHDRECMRGLRMASSKFKHSVSSLNERVSACHWLMTSLPMVDMKISTMDAIGLRSEGVILHSSPFG